MTFQNEQLNDIFNDVYREGKDYDDYLLKKGFESVFEDSKELNEIKIDDFRFVERSPLTKGGYPRFEIWYRNRSGYDQIGLYLFNKDKNIWFHSPSGFQADYRLEGFPKCKETKEIIDFYISHEYDL